MRVKQKQVLWAGSLLFIAVLVAYGLYARGQLGDAQTGGAPAPDISLVTENGEFRLSQQKGKVVVLYFSFPG